MAWRHLALVASCTAIGLAVMLVPASTLHAAEPSAAINDVIGKVGVSATAPSVASETPAAGLPPSPSQPERWKETSLAIESLQLITAEPKPGETCRSVIFDEAEPIRHRIQPRVGDVVPLDLAHVCWIGLRNGSDRRTLALRIGEGVETVAIAPSPALSTGQALRPNEQIRIALRPVGIDRLMVSLEVMWEDHLDTAAEPDAAMMEFKGSAAATERPR